MKKTIAVLLAFLLLFMLLAGCGKKNETTNNNESVSTADPVEVDFSQTDEEMFTERDKKTDYTQTDSVLIQLNGTSATANSDSVKISKNIIKITQEATYIISGTLTDGMIVIDAGQNAKPQIVLDGANITSKTSAALYVLSANKVFVCLANQKTNLLENGGSFEAIDDNNIDAAVFSKQDITFNGTGALTVNSPSGHGIVCKDDLIFTGGDYTVNSSSHGLNANDSVRITGTTNLTVNAGKDGIHCENTDDKSLGFAYISGGAINIKAEGDGIDVGAYAQIQNANFDLLIGGGSENGTKQSSDNFGGFMGGGPGGMRPGGLQNSTTTTDESSTSMKGIKSANNMLINEGTFKINSADDAIHSDVSIIINGGSFEIASGDDAFHAEENLTVTSGTINVTESYEGLEALNLDIKGGNIKVTSDDDGLNAAGGTDSSGTVGGRDGMFGGGKMGMGGMSSGNGSIVISGGNLYINASGDGIDANGTLTVSGGYIIVVGPTQGDTSTLDYDKSATITGGTFIGTGASGMAQTFSASNQGVMSVNVGNQSAGTNITLKDKSGKTVISHTPELSFAVVILSSPEIVSGENYTITVGTLSSEFEAS